MTIARKVVGVGSVGTRAWVLLLVGSDGTDPLLLQAKEAQASVLEQFVGKSRYANQGERVVAGQHLMQASSDIFLGWDRVEGTRRRAAGLLPPPAARLEGLGRHRPHGAPGRWPSTAGCAAGRWPGPTPGPATGSPSPPTSGSGTSFDNAIASFAETYADQNERDYDALKQAAADGRIKVESGL